MSRSSQLARSLYGSVQHALASRQALAGAAQAGLGLLDQPSTSGSTYSSASSIGSYGLVAGSLGIQHLPHSAGQYRQISFWRRSPQPPATQEAHDFGTDGVVGTSTLAAPVDLPVEPAGFFPLQEDSLEVFSAIQSACNALDKASILAAKADTWFLPSWFISALETAHSSLGTPW